MKKDFSQIIDVEVVWSGYCSDSMVDSYISKACWPDGTELTEEELDALYESDMHDEIVAEMFFTGAYV